MPVPQRADARRNHALILAVAEEQVATHGADASLEQIARVAGVGSATVRRHFPTRSALLAAVSRHRIEALCRRAHELAETAERGRGRDALLAWLTDVVDYCVTARGLAVALNYDASAAGGGHDNPCSSALERAAEPLLRHAVRDGAVPAHVTVADLVALTVGIALATEHHPEPAAHAQRLFRLAVSGVSPQPAAPSA